MIPLVRPLSGSWRWREAFAFGRGEKRRPLRIVADTTTVPSGEAYECLHGFAHHPIVEVLMLARNGHGDGDRIIIGEPERPDGGVSIDYFVGDSRGHTGLWPHDYVLTLAERIAEPGSEPDPEAHRAFVLAAAGEEISADVVATRSPYLLDRKPQALADRVNTASPEDAVAVLGLYLRLNGDFTIDCAEGWRDSLGRHFSYFVLMRELLPSAWRWFSACVANAMATGDDEVEGTAQSAMERVDRALRARDRLHGELQQPSGLEPIEEALFYFDVTLLMLGGAFDATARVAHAAHGLTSSPRFAWWTSDSWRRRLNPGLKQLMSPGQPARDARELVAVLRNTIHARSFATMNYQSGGRQEQLVIVPRSVDAELEEVVNRQANAVEFGLHRLPITGELCLDPGRYVEAVFPRAVAALNEIMDATPVEQLDGVDPSKLRLAAPAEETDKNLFHPAVRRRMRLLGGFA
jgi:hypothetical protein